MTSVIYIASQCEIKIANRLQFFINGFRSFLGLSIYQSYLYLVILEITHVVFSLLLFTLRDSIMYHNSYIKLHRRTPITNKKAYFEFVPALANRTSSQQTKHGVGCTPPRCCVWYIVRRTNVYTMQHEKSAFEWDSNVERLRKADDAITTSFYLYYDMRIYQ